MEGNVVCLIAWHLMSEQTGKPIKLILYLKGVRQNTVKSQNTLATSKTVVALSVVLRHTKESPIHGHWEDFLC